MVQPSDKAGSVIADNVRLINKHFSVFFAKTCSLSKMEDWELPKKVVLKIRRNINNSTFQDNEGLSQPSTSWKRNEMKGYLLTQSHKENSSCFLFIDVSKNLVNAK